MFGFSCLFDWLSLSGFDPAVDYFPTTEGGYYLIYEMSVTPMAGAIPFVVFTVSLDLIGDSDMTLYLTTAPIVTTYDDLPTTNKLAAGADSHGTGSISKQSGTPGGLVYIYLSPTPGHEGPDAVRFTAITTTLGTINSVSNVCSS